MLIQYILLALIGLFVLVYILYKLYRMLWSKPNDTCSSGSCNGCPLNKQAPNKQL